MLSHHSVLLEINQVRRVAQVARQRKHAGATELILLMIADRLQHFRVSVVAVVHLLLLLLLKLLMMVHHVNMMIVVRLLMLVARNAGASVLINVLAERHHEVRLFGHLGLLTILWRAVARRALLLVADTRRRRRWSGLLLGWRRFGARRHA